MEENNPREMMDGVEETKPQEQNADLEAEEEEEDDDDYQEDQKDHAETSEEDEDENEEEEEEEEDESEEESESSEEEKDTDMIATATKGRILSLLSTSPLPSSDEDDDDYNYDAQKEEEEEEEGEGEVEIEEEEEEIVIPSAPATEENQEDGDSLETIAKRTRSHLSLRDKQIDELAAFFESESQPGTPEGLEEREEYLLFLQSLREDPIEVQEGTNDSLSAEHDLNNPLSLNATLSSGYGVLAATDDPENDPDFQEFNDEEEDTEEWRNDRGVHVSQKEMEELLQGVTEESIDSAHGRRLRGRPRKAEGQGRQRAASSKLVEVAPRPPLPAPPSISRTPAPYYINPTDGSVLIMGNPNSGDLGSTPAVLLPSPQLHFPYNMATPTTTTAYPYQLYFQPPPPLFTQQQLDQLATQLRQHFQLLVQVYIQTLKTPSPNRPAGVEDTLLELLNELETFRGTGLESTSEGNQQENMTNSNNNVERQTIFDIPGLSELQQFQRLVAASGGEPTALGETLNMFKDHFDPSLKFEPVSASSGRLMFTSAEDNLFLCGLGKFGTDWEKIREHYLPTKSVQQLLNRYKNMTSKRARENPFKAFRESRSKTSKRSRSWNDTNQQLLSPAEFETLEKGITRYGPNFVTIATSCFVGKTPELLRQAWKARTKNKRRRVDEPTSSLKKRGHQSPNRMGSAEVNENLLQDTPQWNSPKSDDLSSPQQLCSSTTGGFAFGFYDDSPTSSPGQEGDGFDEFVLQVEHSGGMVVDSEESQYLLSPDPSDQEKPEQQQMTNQQQITVHPSSQPQVEAPTKVGGDNCMILENGEMVVWTKEEDREILIFSQKHGALNQEAWATLSATRLPSKQPHLLEQRHHQLMSLLASRFAASTSSTSSSPPSPSSTSPGMLTTQTTITT